MQIHNSIKQIIIGAGCDGCGYCVKAFECPAIVFNMKKNQAEIKTDLCINCGQCVPVCSKGHIIDANNTK